MAKTIEKQTMLDLIVEAKRTDPETGSFAEWLAEYLAEHLPAFTPPNEPLTQADLDKMHFDRVWIDYGVSDDGEREGEDGVVLYGKLYSIDTLDGSAFEDLLLDATGHGDTLDNPSGNYTVYRRPPEGEANE